MKDIGIKKKFLMLFLAAALAIGGTAAAHALPIPVNGAQREYYPNGRLRLETVFKNSRLVRKRVYYENGRLMFEERYKNGVALLRRTFYDNGNPKSVWTKKSGVTKYYRRNGTLRAVVDPDSKNLNQDLPSSYIFSGP